MGEDIRRVHSAIQDRGAGVPFGRRSIAGSAALTLALMGGGGLALALPQASPAAAAELPVVEYTVTTGADTPDDGSTPTVEGSLRAVVEQIAEDSATAAERTAFEVTIAAGIGPIELVDYLGLELGAQAGALSIAGASREDTIIDLGEGGIDVIAEDESGIDSLTLKDLTVRNGSGLDLRQAYPDQSELTDVSFTGIRMVSLGGLTTDTMTGVHASDGEVLIEAGDGAGDESAAYTLALSASTFTNAPAEIVAHGDGTHAVTVSDVAMDAAQDAVALHMHDGSGGEASLTVVDSSFTGNATGAISSERVPTVKLSGTTLAENGGEAAMLVSANDGQHSSLALEDTEFTANETDYGALTIRGQVSEFRVTDSQFTGNHSSDGTGAIAAGQNAHSSESDFAFEITNSLFSDNSSDGEGAGAISVPGWLAAGGGAPLEVRGSTFVGNSTQYGGADLAVSTMDGYGGDSSVLIADSTFAASVSAEPTQARSVTFESLAGGSLAIENSTFDGADGEQAAVGVDLIGEGAKISVTHGTFVGGGVQFMEDYSEAGGDVSVRATVFDTAADPLVIDGGSPVITEEHNWTRTASELLGAAEQGSTAEFALDPLADNGGATQTRLPAADSVLIDAAGNDALLATDQRGVKRPQGAATDVGAVERAAAAVALVADLTVVEGEDAAIPVVRDSDAAEALTAGAVATLAAADGTAVLDTDYSFTDGAVEFEPGADSATAQNAELTIPTIKRGGIQGDRTFTVEVAEVADCDTVGEPAEITVTITDADDGTTEGGTDGTTEGTTDGTSDGSSDGTTEGSTDGGTDGATDGDSKAPGNGQGNLATTGGAGWAWPAAIAAAAALVGGALILSRRAARTAGRSGR